MSRGGRSWFVFSRKYLMASKSKLGSRANVNGVDAALSHQRPKRHP
jgi:hypothetical protein